MLAAGRRNHTIDLLRFLAAAWVTLYHFNEPVVYLGNWYRDLCKPGHYGVPIFFILSGYCIGIAGQHASTPKEFLIRRLFRILPPYWFSLAVVLACLLVVKLVTGANSTPLPKTPGGLLAVLTVTTAPLTPHFTINWVYWTLTYELLFYGLIFCSLYFPARIQLLLLTGLLLNGLFLPFFKAGPLVFFNELPLFLLGYALFGLLQQTPHTFLNSLLFLLALLGLYSKHPVPGYFVVAAGVSGLLLIEHYFPLKENLLSRLGDCSYSIYLIHVPVGIYLFGFIKNIPAVQQHIGLNIIVDLILLALITAAASRMYRYVELPSIRLGRKYNSPIPKKQ